MVRISIITLSLLSFVSLTIMIAVFIADLLGYIRTEFATAIVIANLVVQMTLITVLIRKLIKSVRAVGIVSRTADSVSTTGVVIPKENFNDKHIPGDKEILSRSVKPVHPWKYSKFRVIMELVPDLEDRPLKFYIIRKYSNELTEQEVDIIKPSDSSKHVFELNIDPKELINFKFNRDTVVKSFSIDELYNP